MAAVCTNCNTEIPTNVAAAQTSQVFRCSGCNSLILWSGGRVVRATRPSESKRSGDTAATTVRAPPKPTLSPASQPAPEKVPDPVSDKTEQVEHQPPLASDETATTLQPAPPPKRATVTPAPVAPASSGFTVVTAGKRSPASESEDETTSPVDRSPTASVDDDAATTHRPGAPSASSAQVSDDAPTTLLATTPPTAGRETAAPKGAITELPTAPAVASPAATNIAMGGATEPHPLYKLSLERWQLGAMASGVVLLVLIAILAFRPTTPDPTKAPVAPPNPSTAPIATQLVPPTPAPQPSVQPRPSAPVVKPLASQKAATRPVRPAKATATSPTARPIHSQSSKRRASRAVSAPADNAAAAGLYRKGNERLLAGDYRGAVREYQQALSAAPGYSTTYRGLGIAYERLGDKAKAAAAYAAYLKRAPHASDAASIKLRLSQIKKK